MLLGCCLALTVGLLSVSSCAHVPLAPVPQDRRIPISVATKDLTGTGVDAEFLSHLRANIEADFVVMAKDISRENPGFAETWLLCRTANPLRLAGEGESPRLRVTAEVERAEYGPAPKNDDALIGYILFGIPGALMAAGGSQGVVLATVQYRFTVTGSCEDRSFVVLIGRAARVDDVSRAELMTRLGNDVRERLVFGLAETLQRCGLHQLKQEWIQGSSEAAVREIAARRPAAVAP